MQQNTFFRIRSFAVGAALCLPLVGCAVTSEQKAGQVDPQAIQRIQDLSDTLSQSSSFAFNVTAEQAVVDQSGKQVTSAITIGVDLNREFGIRARAGSKHINYNRRFLTVADERLELFANAAMPSDMDVAITAAHDIYGIAFPVADLLFSNPADALLSDVRGARYLGRTEIDGRPVDHLSFRQSGIDWEIWVTSGEKTLPARLALRYLDEEGRPTKTFQFYDWNLTPQHVEGDFEYRPNPTMSRIQFRKQ